MAMDATFIKAYSKRDSRDNRRGASDPDALVGRDGRSYGLGYKAHIAADVDSDLPVSFTAASANENEKKHAPELLDKTVEVTGGRIETLVADSQYSSRRFREKVADSGVMAVIPYPSNQRKGEDVLRVDRKFRTHGPEDERAKYHMRPAVEAAYAFLKTQYGMRGNKVRRLGRVAVYALYSVLCHVLTREAAENIGLPDKAVSPTFFNT